MASENNDNNVPASPQPSPQSTCACSKPGPLRWLLIAVMVVVIIVIAKDKIISPEPDTPAVTWRTDHTAALADAATQSKPILLAFHASWCGPCKQMKRNTYHDPDVITAADRFVRVIIDIDKSPEIPDKYQVVAVPTYIVLSPTGAELTQFAGFFEPADFISKLNAALD